MQHPSEHFTHFVCRCPVRSTFTPPLAYTYADINYNLFKIINLLYNLIIQHQHTYNRNLIGVRFHKSILKVWQARSLPHIFNEVKTTATQQCGGHWTVTEWSSRCAIVWQAVRWHMSQVCAGRHVIQVDWRLYAASQSDSLVGENDVIDPWPL